MWTFILPLLIYWLVLFVACFVVVEIGQDQLYDEVTPHAGLKIAGGTLILALLLTILRARGLTASFETMFTSNIAWTILQGIVWFGVFVLIFQFHPWHGLGLGLATMALITGLATMGVESLLKKPVPTLQSSSRSLILNKPVRQSVPRPVAPITPTTPATPAK